MPSVTQQLLPIARLVWPKVDLTKCEVETSYDENGALWLDCYTVVKGRREDLRTTKIIDQGSYPVDARRLLTTAQLNLAKRLAIRPTQKSRRG